MLETKDHGLSHLGPLCVEIPVMSRDAKCTHQLLGLVFCQDIFIPEYSNIISRHFFTTFGGSCILVCTDTSFLMYAMCSKYLKVSKEICR